jgi:NADH:ubiquinone oxidoreductase subunit K
MALPITHYLYLSLALFGVGFGGALLRRSLIATLCSIALMFGALTLLFCAYARFFIDAGGQRIALVVALVGLLEIVIAAAVALRARRAEQAEGRERSLIDDWHAAGGEG